ncbi:MAG: UDP-3-O-[3-hydroxymyristoyl] N-acetylglucosamine deacetylase [Deltaproteobacteria bacterium]|nr:MAG: UDP-3-O-[3-hydroxymyristoyl] N-acetylglucosamine deacetylase [Deltaproteobacteria bacterium]
MRQRTLKKNVVCSGIGLHSGKKLRLVMRPADQDTGIVFQHLADGGKRILRPTPEGVVSTGLATTLGVGDRCIATVEHLMAAIAGLSIDNIIIEVHGNEIPIMDGSAASFVFLLRSAGIRKQGHAKRVFRVKREVVFEKDGKVIKAAPYAGFRVNYTIDFDHPLVGRQTFTLDLSPETFAREIARARTFGFMKDVEMLQRNGLALGGSLENAVVLDEYGVINPDGLRFQDELVRHKVLDFIGDMHLLEHPLQGDFSVTCSGHGHNNAFLRYLSANKAYYLDEVVLDGRTRIPAANEEPIMSMEPVLT